MYTYCPRPVGLDPVCNHMEQICTHSHHLSRCPGHIMLTLDSGEGRTTLVEYMANLYKQHNILSFSAGPDDYLELSFNGSSPQMRKNFEIIEDASVYANCAFDGVITMDISNLAAPLQEAVIAEFVTLFHKTCAHASVLFFLPGTPNRNQVRLAERLQAMIPGITPFFQKSYTIQELTELTVRRLTESGIAIQDGPEFRKELGHCLNFFGVRRVGDIHCICEYILSAMVQTDAPMSLDYRMLHTICNDTVHSTLEKGGITNAQ